MTRTIPSIEEDWRCQLSIRYTRLTKTKTILHVNMLRPWCTPKETSGLAEEITNLESEDVPVWKEESADQTEPGLEKSCQKDSVLESEICWKSLQM